MKWLMILLAILLVSCSPESSESSSASAEIESGKAVQLKEGENRLSIPDGYDLYTLTLTTGKSYTGSETAAFSIASAPISKSAASTVTMTNSLKEIVGSELTAPYTGTATLYKETDHLAFYFADNLLSSEKTLAAFVVEKLKDNLDSIAVQEAQLIANSSMEALDLDGDALFRIYFYSTTEQSSYDGFVALNDYLVYGSDCFYLNITNTVLKESPSMDYLLNDTIKVFIHEYFHFLSKKADYLDPYFRIEGMASFVSYLFRTDAVKKSNLLNDCAYVLFDMYRYHPLKHLFGKTSYSYSDYVQGSRFFFYLYSRFGLETVLKLKTSSNLVADTEALTGLSFTVLYRDFLLSFLASSSITFDQNATEIDWSGIGLISDAYLKFILAYMHTNSTRYSFYDPYVKSGESVQEDAYPVCGFLINKWEGNPEKLYIEKDSGVEIWAFALKREDA